MLCFSATTPYSHFTTIYSSVKSEVLISPHPHIQSMRKNDGIIENVLFFYINRFSILPDFNRNYSIIFPHDLFSVGDLRVNFQKKRWLCAEKCEEKSFYFSS